MGGLLTCWRPDASARIFLKGAGAGLVVGPKKKHLQNGSKDKSDHRNNQNNANNLKKIQVQGVEEFYYYICPPTGQPDHDVPQASFPHPIQAPVATRYEDLVSNCSQSSSFVEQQENIRNIISRTAQETIDIGSYRNDAEEKSKAAERYQDFNISNILVSPRPCEAFKALPSALSPRSSLQILEAPPLDTEIIMKSSHELGKAIREMSVQHEDKLVVHFQFFLEED